MFYKLVESMRTVVYRILLRNVSSPPMAVGTLSMLPLPVTAPVTAPDLPHSKICFSSGPLFCSPPV